MRMNLVERTILLRDQVESLSFPSSVVVYDPLLYAWEPHKTYLETYCNHSVSILLLGMNPGPFGMAQTGVPFGEVNAVRDFLHIQGVVGKPKREHPKRPVLGFGCHRSEISGRRLWSFLKDRYGTSEQCFSILTVMNYCPLVFMDSGPTGRNVTPDKLDKDVRVLLEGFCDAYLKDCIEYFNPKYLVGIGQYAKKKLSSFSEGRILDSIIHPSPGNPQANHDWPQKVEKSFLSWKLDN